MRATIGTCAIVAATASPHASSHPPHPKPLLSSSALDHRVYSLPPRHLSGIGLLRPVRHVAGTVGETVSLFAALRLLSSLAHPRQPWASTDTMCSVPSRARHALSPRSSCRTAPASSAHTKNRRRQGKCHAPIHDVADARGCAGRGFDVWRGMYRRVVDGNILLKSAATRSVFAEVQAAAASAAFWAEGPPHSLAARCSSFTSPTSGTRLHVVNYIVLKDHLMGLGVHCSSHVINATKNTWLST